MQFDGMTLSVINKSQLRFQCPEVGVLDITESDQRYTNGENTIKWRWSAVNRESPAWFKLITLRIVLLCRGFAQLDTLSAPAEPYILVRGKPIRRIPKFRFLQSLFFRSCDWYPVKWRRAPGIFWKEPNQLKVHLLMYSSTSLSRIGSTKWSVLSLIDSLALDLQRLVTGPTWHQHTPFQQRTSRPLWVITLPQPYRITELWRAKSSFEKSEVNVAKRQIFITPIFFVLLFLPLKLRPVGSCWISIISSSGVASVI